MSKYYSTATLDLDAEGNWSVAIADEQYGQGGFEGWGRTRLGDFKTVGEAVDALRAWFTEEHIQKIKARIEEVK